MDQNNVGQDNVALDTNVEEMRGQVELGGGAQFWAYISPQNNTAQVLTSWAVTLEQTDGNWTGTISSANPQQTLQTPNLSGVFNVRVRVSLKQMVELDCQPLPDTNPNVGCNANCAAMVGIVATPDGQNANYWTVWDAFCS